VIKLSSVLLITRFIMSTFSINVRFFGQDILKRSPYSLKREWNYLYKKLTLGIVIAW